MNLEKHVVSLEIAKLLKENGFKKETFAYWIERPEGGFYLDCNKLASPLCGEREFFYAPLVTELMDCLPHRILFKPNSDEFLYLSLNFLGEFECGNLKDYYVCYRGENNLCRNMNYSKTPSEALALLWIELVKNEL